MGQLSSPNGIVKTNTRASSMRSRVILKKLSFSNQSIVYVWTGENDTKTLRVGANIFENGEKKLR